MSVTPSMAGLGSSESCPNCGAQMAADQRYCLGCGRRRGEPRLPFMDAVVFMESMKTPGGGPGVGATPPPPPTKSDSTCRWNANAALIAGVATLVLAIGVGFLIGRSGHDDSSQAAAPQVIKVEGGSGGGGEETAAAAPEESITGAKRSSKSKGGSKKSAGKTSPKATPKAEANSETGEHGTSKATEEVLHTEEGVEFAEPEVKVGGSCEKGTAGCGESGKFEGNFFGE